MNVHLDLDPRIFNKIYLTHQLRNQNRYQIYYGGSSSGKSVSLAQRCVLDVLKGRNYLIVRNVGRTLRTSCFNEIRKQINFMQLSRFFKVNIGDMNISCLLNNKQILFQGLDDSEKIKSITPIDGVITDIWVEEATECEYRDIKQLDKRLRGVSKFRKRLILSFNPILQDHWIYTQYFSIWDDSKQYVEKDNVSILKTTYSDNHFLTPDDIDALENETDPYFKDVYTDGKWGVLGNIIFKNWTPKDLSEIRKSFETFNNGHDFGFGEDPDAFVHMHYDKSRKTLYILDEIYARGLFIDELAEKMRGIIGNKLVICDSQDPRSIAELKRQGVLAVPANKGPDSVDFGIKWLQRQKIIIDIRCQNTINEFKKYKWKEDKNGNVLPIPVDKFNHAIDAIRYGCEELMEPYKPYGAAVASSGIFEDDDL